MKHQDILGSRRALPVGTNARPSVDSVVATVPGARAPSFRQAFIVALALYSKPFALHAKNVTLLDGQDRSANAPDPSDRQRGS